MAKISPADLPAEPVLQRSCAACGAVDDGPRNTVDLGGGRAAFFHLSGSPDCAVPGADPHPELNEDAATSQLRYALTIDALSPTPDPSESLVVATIDASDPENFTRAPDDTAPRDDPEDPEA
jgi:hypothetical protein